MRRQKIEPTAIEKGHEGVFLKHDGTKVSGIVQRVVVKGGVHKAVYLTDGTRIGTTKIKSASVNVEKVETSTRGRKAADGDGEATPKKKRGSKKKARATRASVRRRRGASALHQKISELQVALDEALEEAAASNQVDALEEAKQHLGNAHTNLIVALNAYRAQLGEVMAGLPRGSRAYVKKVMAENLTLTRSAIGTLSLRVLNRNIKDGAVSSGEKPARKKRASNKTASKKTSSKKKSTGKKKTTAKS